MDFLSKHYQTVHLNDHAALDIREVVRDSPVVGCWAAGVQTMQCMLQSLGTYKSCSYLEYLLINKLKGGHVRKMETFSFAMEAVCLKH